MCAWLRRKKIRNEMDLLELGVRKRSNAFKLMAAIRDTDMEHWSKIDEAGCVMLGVFCVHRSSGIDNLVGHCLWPSGCYLICSRSCLLRLPSMDARLWSSP